MFSERQQRILSCIASTRQPITGQEVADLLNLSLRTVQRDISRINRSQQIVQSSYEGYSINAAMLTEVLKLDHTKNEGSNAASTDHALLKMLALASQPIDIDDAAEHLFVSTPVLERSIRMIREGLSPYKLELIRQRNKLSLKGDESGKRALMGALLIDEVSGQFSSIDGVAHYFKGMDFERAKATVLEAINRHGQRIKPGYARGLIINVAIALYRMRAHSYIQTGKPRKQQNDIEHEIAASICAEYATHCPINPGAAEIDYLASLLSGQIEPNDSIDAPKATADISDLEKTVKRVVDKAFGFFQLNVEFSQAIRNFSMHIKALIERVDAIQITDTEMLENVKRNCPFVYELSILIAQGLSEAFHIHIEDGELGFISIHVGLLIEDTLADEKVHIVLACDQYQSISKRIRNEIENRFAGVAVVTELDELGREDREVPLTDLIVTTRAMECTMHNAVYVSPFFTPSDYLKIENAIGLCLHEKRAAQTKRLLEPFFDDRLFLKRNVQNEHEAICLLGQKLFDCGIVDDGFIESVLQREQLSPTSFFNLFAIPHALEMNAKRTMAAVLLSEQGVSWGAERVHIVLMIAVCADDRRRFMEIYDTVVNSLCERRRVRKLLSSNTLSDFLEKLING